MAIPTPDVAAGGGSILQALQRVAMRPDEPSQGAQFFQSQVDRLLREEERKRRYEEIGIDPGNFFREPFQVSPTARPGGSVRGVTRPGMNTQMVEPMDDSPIMGVLR